MSTTEIDEITNNIKGLNVNEEETIDSDKILDINALRNLEEFKNYKKKKNQYDHYVSKGAKEEILRYVSIEGKGFGAEMEKLAREWLCMDNREKKKSKKNVTKKKEDTDTTYDHLKNGEKIEQKSTRYGSGGSPGKWQHINIDHEWNYLLLAFLDYNDIKYHIAPKAKILELIKKKVIKGQGTDGEPDQGYWFDMSDFKKNDVKFEDYFTEIKNSKSLEIYLQKKVNIKSKAIDI